MEQMNSIVYVVDDDEGVRAALENLLESAGFEVQVFSSTSNFRAHERAETPSCLILDVRLKGESGLAFQEWALENRITIPIIFMTGYGDVEMSVQAMKGGAVNFLAKPFREQDMLEAVTEALTIDEARLKTRRLSEALRKMFSTLTPRERDIARLVAAGHINRVTAEKLGLTEMTVKIYRGRVMKKLSARSKAELVKKVRALCPDEESQ
ncbi:response regulator transcription factor [Paraburkholderia unamae]|uniref:FixJ family two-component response regulator n=1 Tax=Paraburkholderia unamae TaxID=219649 RepID=A0ABX5KT05_9BURK|nr:response regulator [Paraburkholderia unamae]PVX85911.1 FixJ family two-component response regulator [Paraburkholderia unamae]